MRTDKLYIGCAVWAFRGWLGDFYPRGSRQEDFLELYAARMTAVEGNTTFYALPSSETVSKWAANMPQGFKFCPKLERRITHEGKLSEGLKRAELFIERMTPLGDNLGPFLVQLPPSYGPAAYHDLKRFLKWWPHDDYPMALELRNEGWWLDAPKARLAELLGELGVAKVLLDTRPIYDADDDPQRFSERKKPPVPHEPELTADFTMIRYIGHPTPDNNTPYMAGWAARVALWLERDATVYYFSHCPMEERSPGYARTFYNMLSARGVDSNALPWLDIPAPPKQMGLF